MEGKVYYSNDEYFKDYPEDYDSFVDDMAEMYSEVIDYPEDWDLK